MSVKSKFRGHEIEHTKAGWIFSESRNPVTEDVPCGNCGCAKTPEGHDNCLGTLPGLMNACCGHGKPEEAYVQFLDGSGLRGDSAHIVIEELKKTKTDRWKNET